MSLFENNYEKVKPLALKMRPTTLDDFIGQEKILGKGGILRKLIEKTDNIKLHILWTTGVWEKFIGRDNF